VPKDMTGYDAVDVDRRRWASMERLLFEAQTVQNLSLYESAGADEALTSLSLVVVGVVSLACTGAGGVGAAGWGGCGVEVRFAAAAWRRARRGSTDMRGNEEDYTGMAIAMDVSL